MPNPWHPTYHANNDTNQREQTTSHHRTKYLLIPHPATPMPPQGNAACANNQGPLITCGGGERWAGDIRKCQSKFVAGVVRTEGFNTGLCAASQHLHICSSQVSSPLSSSPAVTYRAAHGAQHRGARAATNSSSRNLLPGAKGPEGLLQGKDGEHWVGAGKHKLLEGCGGLHCEEMFPHMLTVTQTPAQSTRR